MSFSVRKVSPKYYSLKQLLKILLGLCDDFKKGTQVHEARGFRVLDMGGKGGKRRMGDKLTGM
jgi:hypothetical protein